MLATLNEAEICRVEGGAYNYAAWTNIDSDGVEVSYEMVYDDNGKIIMKSYSVGGVQVYYWSNR
jgi:hypothetical protein